MTQSLWNSLSGLTGSLSWLNQTANNLANVNTPGFAADTGSFADTLTQAMSGRATAVNNATRYTPPGWWGGTGVAATKTEKNFSQMPLNQTGNKTDLAIQGNAFFVVQGSNGQPLLTKAGNFIWSQQTNGSFELATPQGQAVLDVNGKPIVQPGTGNTANPALANSFSVGPDGQVSFNGKPTQKIALARVFLPGENLTSVGNNEFALGPGAGGQPVVINRGAGATTSTVVQGALSGSNVDMSTAMANLLQAQQMYNMNTEAIQLTNRMMNDADTIR